MIVRDRKIHDTGAIIEVDGPRELPGRLPCHTVMIIWQDLDVWGSMRWLYYDILPREKDYPSGYHFVKDHSHPCK